MKIDKDFFKKYSLEEINFFLQKKNLTGLDLIKFVLDNIIFYKNYNFLTTSSLNILKKKKFLENLDFNKDKPLISIPFLAKDIFNTIEFNTEMGSDIWKNFRAGNNARVIDNLIQEGSILIGKSTTAEFAVHHETLGKNALDPKRMAGTSSTGSAIAVALGVVPFALGTQTAGSITRPASYNGIYGVKPTFGLIPRTGILKTCDSLDTVGFLTSKFENIKLILNSIRVRGRNYPFVNEFVDIEKKIIPRRLKVGFIKTYTWNNLEGYTKENFLNFINKLNSCFSVNEIKLDDNFQDIHVLHQKIYYKSLSYYFKREKKLGLKLSKNIKQIIKKGEKISSDDFKQSIKKQNYLINKFDHIISEYDIVISPATTGIAPKKNEKEKDDSALIWTFLHVPSIYAPLFKGPDSMPFGLQFIGKKWDDLNILNIMSIFKDKKLIS